MFLNFLGWKEQRLDLYSFTRVSRWSADCMGNRLIRTHSSGTRLFLTVSKNYRQKLRVFVVAFMYLWPINEHKC